MCRVLYLMRRKEEVERRKEKGESRKEKVGRRKVREEIGVSEEIGVRSEELRYALRA